MIRASSIRPGVRLRSNDGRGPALAMITKIAGRTVYLERWTPNDKGRQKYRRFHLTKDFLASPSCGWRTP